MKRDDASLEGVLAVADWILIGAFALIAINLVLAPLAGPPVWIAVYTATLAVVAVVGLVGRLSRARWRMSVYPILVFVAGAPALWANGPLAGVGAAFGLATILAATFASRAALALLVVACVGAVGAKMVTSVGVWSTPDPTVMSFGSFPVWLRVAVVTAFTLWLGTRLIEALVASLEGALVRTVDAYREETESRAELATSRRELEELEQVELVGRLAGGVAHDVNNALTAILAASDVLGDDVTTERHRRALRELEAESQRAAQLVRDLLWIGRKLSPTTDTARLGDAIEACRRRLERMSRALALDVNIERDAFVAIAPERLEQIVFWVVIRAHRAGTGQLALSGRRAGREVLIEVRGSRGAASASGSGNSAPKALRAQLGVSAATEVVAQAGGRVTIADDANSLHVTIVLPAAITQEQPATAHGSGTTALVVDDDPLVLSRLVRLVERRGYHVRSAASLAEAWPLLDAGPDLLVTDLQLGDGRGEALAIASFERKPARPIVVCSGFGADDELRDRLRGAQVTFLAKPFTRAELDSAIPQVDGGAA